MKENSDKMMDEIFWKPFAKVDKEIKKHYEKKNWSMLYRILVNKYNVIYVRDSVFYIMKKNLRGKVNWNTKGKFILVYKYHASGLTCEFHLLSDNLMHEPKNINFIIFKEDIKKM